MKPAAGARGGAVAPDKPASARGFTLIEILVTFAVLAVMLVLAAPSFVAFQRSSELTSTANAFMASLSVARAEATKRQLNAFVEAGSPTSAAAADWSGGWFVYLDVDNSLDYTAGVDVLVSQTGALPASVAVNVTANANAFVDPAVTRPYVMFNGSGFLRTRSGAFVAEGVLELKNRVGGEVRCVAASPSGRLRVGKPDAGAHCAVDTLPAGG